MNSDILQGKWNEIKGQVKAKWGKLTDDDLTYVAGRSEHLKGILQKRYGYKREDAEQQVDGFLNKLG